MHSPSASQKQRRISQIRTQDRAARAGTWEKRADSNPRLPGFDMQSGSGITYMGCFQQNRMHRAQINNIPRWAKQIVFVIKLNLLLPCFGLSTSLHRRTQSMSLYGHAAYRVVESWFNSQLRRYVIYLSMVQNVKQNYETFL